MNIIHNDQNTVYSKDMIAHAAVLRFVEEVKKKENRDKYWKDVAYVEKSLMGKLSYTQGILLQDLMYRKYHLIKKDIFNNKITEKDVDMLIDKANAIRKIFDKIEVFHRIKCS